MAIEATGGSFGPQPSSVGGGREAQQAGDSGKISNMVVTLDPNAGSSIDQAASEVDVPAQTDIPISDFTGMSNEAIAAQVRAEVTEDIGTGQVSQEVLDDAAERLTAQKGKGKGGTKEVGKSEEEVQESEAGRDKEDTSGRSGVQAVKKPEDITKPEAKKQLQRKDEFADQLLDLLKKKQSSGQLIQPHEYIKLATEGDPKAQPPIEGFKDPTLAYVALRHVRDKFAKSDDNTEAQLSISTLSACDVMLHEQGPLIRAGWLLGVDEPALHDYCIIVLRFDKLPDLFSALVEKAGGKKKEVNDLTEKLIKSIGIEIKTQEATLDPIHLQQIMSSLTKVRLCDQVLKESGLLIINMQEEYGTQGAQGE